MIRTIITIILLGVALNAHTQLIGHNLYPSDKPSDEDTIKSFLTLLLPQDSRKQSSRLEFSNDSILYYSCYEKDNVFLFSDVYDTVILSPLGVGIYQYRILVNRTPDHLDNYCERPDIITRIYDTLLIVSEYTGISQASPAQWQAVLLGASTLQLYTPSAATASVSVYDATGKAYYQGFYTTVAGTNNVLLDIPNQATGLYIYHIQIGDQRRVLKFVKQ